MIKITVVTITFNAAKVFARTADSVMSQTYPCIEHLIIDGASTDGTVEMASDYMKSSNNRNNGHNVILSSEPDKGLYDAMNKGLAKATGDYIIFMNAGDYFHEPTTLQMIAETAEKNKKDGDLPAVIYGDTDIMDAEGNFLFRREHRPPENLNWHSFRHGMLVCHQAFYARRDIAQQTEYDLKYRYSADVDWCIRVMKEAEKRGVPLVNTHKTVANYLREGQTTMHHRASLKERFDVMRTHYGLCTTVAMHIYFIFRDIKRKLATS